MSRLIRYIKVAAIFLAFVMFGSACQKMSRPALGDYPKDLDPHFPLYPGGPLKFYAAFDGTTSNPLMNAVDSIRANFPANNPLTSVQGISGHAIQGDGTKTVTYAGGNDFISTASSFTIALWEKRNGAPQGNASFFFSFGSSNKYWANASMFGLFDWGTVADSAIIKIDVIDKTVSDNWFQWTGNKRVPGLQDNNWHHLAFVYDATTSIMTLYVDGKANPNTQSWGSHGPANLDATKITGLSIGGNSGIKDLGWGQNWDGSLDQFRLYNKALTATEVNTLFSNKQ